MKKKLSKRANLYKQQSQAAVLFTENFYNILTDNPEANPDEKS